MKTALGFLTEEGHTRRKNASKRICLYACLMFAIAGAGGYAFHRFFASELTPLQRIYFKQYLKSSWRSYLPKSRSRYTTLAAIVRQPQTNHDVVLSPTDDNVEPVLDDQGHIKFDALHRPVFQLKPGEITKGLFWQSNIVRDQQAYDWFRATIYEGITIPDIWRAAWVSALLIFIFGMTGAIALDVFAQQRYLRGESIRGTRELSPKAYAREHRRDKGYELMVYTQGSTQ